MKGARRPNAAQMRGAAKSAERKAVKDFWHKAQEYDAANLRCAQYFLEHRREFGEESIQVVYAHIVMARLRPDWEF